MRVQLCTRSVTDLAEGNLTGEPMLDLYPEINVSEKIHCQSCSRSIKGESDFGTEADGSRCAEYCSCCYQNGAFTEQTVTVDEMVDRVIGIVVEYNIMPREVAKERIPGLIRKLKRWCV